VWFRRSGSIIGFFILSAVILIVLGLRGLPMITSCSLRGTLRATRLPCPMCGLAGVTISPFPFAVLSSLVPGTASQGKMQRFGVIMAIFRFLVPGATSGKLAVLRQGFPIWACIGGGGGLTQLFVLPAQRSFQVSPVVKVHVCMCLRQGTV
jgi:hypothetical protein